MAGLKFSSRTHKERSQPSARAKLGLLEKHKDYALRARNYNFKQKRLKALKTKALLRNPDEFYFGMINSKTKGGVHIQEQRTEKYEGDVLKLLKTQDEKYVTMQRNKETKKIEKISQQILPEFQGTRTVYLEEKKELDEYLMKKMEEKEKEKSVQGPKGKLKKKLEKELEVAKKREEKLKIAEKELQIQRSLMSKGKRQKVGEDERGLAIFKWKAIRKK